MIKSVGFNHQELEKFKAAQKASYEILESVAASLREGLSERQVTTQLLNEYKKLGVKSFFHLPVALFGQRAALPGKWKTGHFWPRKNLLEANQSVILDASPIIDGYLVDTSYSCCFGEDPTHQKMLLDLMPMREQVLKAVHSGKTFKEIAIEIDDCIRALGYENCHEKHLEHVLGHRIIKMLTPKLTWTIMKGFDARVLSWFGLRTVLAKKGLSNNSPNWNMLSTSNHQPWEGLWAVEPHVGNNEHGAKWEEIMVIPKSGFQDAYWLDDDNPHMRHWQKSA